MMKLTLFLAAAMVAPAMASAQDAPAGDYPRCTAAVTDHCTEGGGMGMGHHHMMMKHHHHMMKHHHHMAKADKK